jgi:hypothetical protein
MKLTTLDARPHENAPNLGRKEHRNSKLHGGRRDQIRQLGGYPGADLQILRFYQGKRGERGKREERAKRPACGSSAPRPVQQFGAAPLPKAHHAAPRAPPTEPVKFTRRKKTTIATALPHSLRSRAVVTVSNKPCAPLPCDRCQCTGSRSVASMACVRVCVRSDAIHAASSPCLDLDLPLSR